MDPERAADGKSIILAGLTLGATISNSEGTGGLLCLGTIVAPASKVSQRKGVKVFNRIL